MYKNIYTCTVGVYPVYSQCYYSLDLANNDHLVLALPSKCQVCNKPIGLRMVSFLREVFIKATVLAGDLKERATRQLTAAAWRSDKEHFIVTRYRSDKAEAK